MFFHLRRKPILWESFFRWGLLILLVFWTMFLNTVLACPPSTIVYADQEESVPADEVVKQGEMFTHRWLVRNDSTCDAVDYRLGFYSATLNEASYSGSTFGGSNHPKVSISAGGQAQMEVSFVVPQEVGNYRVDVDVLDGAGVALPPLAMRLYTTFKVVEATPVVTPPPSQVSTDCATQTQIPRSECETLIALYNSTNGPGWSDSATNNWGKTNEPCGWQDIVCAWADNSGINHVTEIRRESVNLVGTLPNLNNLTYLQSLYLGNNSLTGTIPDLSSLTYLQSLYLGNNSLTGTIPNLSSLTNLRNIDLSDNFLSGTIPTLSGLINLEWVGLGNNLLTGTIPNLSGLTNLRNIFLSYNFLSGTIPTLSGLINLEWVGLRNNLLTGTIPNLNSLTSLQYFDSSNNFLIGSIPDLSNLNNLYDLSLSNNQLQGAIQNLSGFNSLGRILLDHNHLSGEIPLSLSTLSNLSLLGLGDNCLTASDPTLIAFLDQQDPYWKEQKTTCFSGNYTISGTVSLPEGEVAPAGGVEMCIYISFFDGNSNTSVLDWGHLYSIPENQSSVPFLLLAPEVASMTWHLGVRGYQTEGKTTLCEIFEPFFPNEYKRGYYSTSGTVVDPNSATLLSGGQNYSNINLTLLPPTGSVPPVLPSDNQPPVYLSGSASPATIKVGQPITFQTTWDDPDKGNGDPDKADYIVNVKVKYCLQGTTDCTIEVLAFLNGDPPVFSKQLTLTTPGTYSYQFIAVDAYPSDTPRRPESEMTWQGNGTFTVVSETPVIIEQPPVSQDDSTTPNPVSEVVVDTPPSIIISSHPATVTVRDTDHINISGTASFSPPNKPPKITWENNRGDKGSAFFSEINFVEGTLVWNQDNIPLKLGETIITVTIYDSAGLQSSASITVTIPNLSQDQLLAKYAPILNFADGDYTPRAIDDFIAHSSLAKMVGRADIVGFGENALKQDVSNKYQLLEASLPLDIGKVFSISTPPELEEGKLYSLDLLNGVHGGEDYVACSPSALCTITSMCPSRFYNVCQSNPPIDLNNGAKPTIYTHYVEQGNKKYLQYHFFYYINEWNGNGGPYGIGYHEGDWEYMVIELDENNHPTRISTSVHVPGKDINCTSKNGGETIRYSKSLQQDGHPVAFVGKGGHPTYLTKGATKYSFLTGFSGTDYHNEESQRYLPPDIKKSNFGDTTYELVSIVGNVSTWLSKNIIWGHNDPEIPGDKEIIEPAVKSPLARSLLKEDDGRWDNPKAWMDARECSSEISTDSRVVSELPPPEPELVCASSGSISKSCDATGQTLTDVTLEEHVSIASVNLQGNVINKGQIANSTLSEGSTLTGGLLTSTITNHGTIRDVTFGGSELTGGTLAGTITVTHQSQKLGILRDVSLASNAVVKGGQLAGTIQGDPNAPARLENTLIKANSHLSGVIIGEGVILEAGVIIDPLPLSIDIPALPTDTPENRVVHATNAGGKEVATTSTIRMGVSVDGDEFVTFASATPQQRITVMANIYPEPTHLGKRADILLGMGVETQPPLDGGVDTVYYSIDDQGNQTPVNFYASSKEWMAQLTEPLRGRFILQSASSIPLWEGEFTEEGRYYFFSGYRLEDGTIIYTAQPVTVEVR